MPSTDRRLPPTPVLSSRDKILSAAVELMAERGAEGLSLRVLAKQVGLHNSTLLHHFVGKAGLIDAVLGAVMERNREITSELSATSAELEPMLRVMGDWSTHLSSAPHERQLLLRTLSDPTTGAEHPLAELMQDLSKWFTRARRKGSIRDVPARQASGWVLALLLFEPSVGDPMRPEARTASLRDALARIFSPDS